MPATEFRIFFDNVPATSDQLDRIEEITVEQEVDMAWEARIKIPIYVDADGNWSTEPEDFIGSFSRVRVEIKVGEAPFVALIDGPLVGLDRHLYSDPGRSTAVLSIMDDSVFLNRDEQVSRFEDLLDHEIAWQVFDQYSQIASTTIQETPAPGDSLPPVVVQRETSMQLLRRLARRNGMHAYVLPGTNPGQSIGCFKAFPEEGLELPPLLLLGPERNMEMFNCTYDAQRPSRVRTSTLDITDKSIASATAGPEDLVALGDEPALESGVNPAARMLPPGLGQSVDPNQATLAVADRDSYAFQAEGKVRSASYAGILQPYLLVAVTGVNAAWCGDYLITRVTHAINRSKYNQSFTLCRNARSIGSTGGLEDIAGGIF